MKIAKKVMVDGDVWYEARFKELRGYGLTIYDAFCDCLMRINRMINEK